jgi:hypothetical protein
MDCWESLDVRCATERILCVPGNESGASSTLGNHYAKISRSIFSYVVTTEVINHPLPLYL